MKRRNFFKNSTMLAAATAAPHYAFNIHNKRKIEGALIGHGDFRYHVDRHWGDQDPAQIPIKNCHEMVEDSQGRLILVTDHVKNNVLIYDKSGKVLKTWTLNSPGAHGLTISKEGGEEFLFITDSEINKVYKTTLDGKVLMTLDYPKEIIDYQEAKQWKPTEVAVAPNGDFFVADGYGLNFITRYSSKGEYISHFGGKGEEDGQFNCCHGIVVDQRGATPELLITSRASQSFKRFTMDGQHLKTIKLTGCDICRPVLKGDNLYFAVIATKTWGSYDGAVAILDKNDQVVSFPGATAPVYEAGNLIQPDADETFLNPHDVCVDKDENIYVTQWYSGRTYPFRLERV